MIDVEDRVLIHEVIALHGHLVDEGEFHRLTEVFVPEVEYDVSALGGEILHGVDAVAAAGLRLGERNPLSHHVTNTVVERLEDDRSFAIQGTRRHVRGDDGIRDLHRRPGARRGGLADQQSGRPSST